MCPVGKWRDELIVLRIEKMIDQELQKGRRGRNFVACREMERRIDCITHRENDRSRITER